MTDEEPLPGGNMGGAARVGGIVRRAAGPWTPTVQGLLAHLRSAGLIWVPEPRGTGPDGRDQVTYLPGVVPQYPMPEWIWDESVLVDAAGRLAELHRASAGYDRTGAVWQIPGHEPAEVVCHNDFAPYNMVFDDGRLTGVIDWDTASPGPRVWDLAYLAYRLVPLSGSGADVPGRAHRLRLLCDTYGHGLHPAGVLPVVVERLHDLAAFTRARADAGQPELHSHVGLYLDDARWVLDHTGDLTA